MMQQPATTALDKGPKGRGAGAPAAPTAPTPAPASGGADLLVGCSWWCMPTSPGAAAPPGTLSGILERYRAAVPGTVAAALRSAGVAGWRERDLDGEDWWFVTTVEVPPGLDRPLLLELDGVATFASVFWNGELVVEGSSMFVPLVARLERLAQRNELAICCRALTPRISRRAGRGRWRNTLVERQGLRAVRTTLLGRINGWAFGAAPVGPWRPVRLRPADEPRLELRRLVCRLERHRGEILGELERCDGEVPDKSGGRRRIDLVHGGAGRTEGGDRGGGESDGDGLVELEAVLHGLPGADREGAELRVGGAAVLATLEPAQTPGSWLLSASLRLPAVSAWWPHTHGGQARYEASVGVGGTELSLGTVGFRSIEADRSDGGFTLVVNGVPLFARGVCWMPPDPVALDAGPEAVRAAVELLREANCNLVRLPGTTVYESDHFFTACDELGLLVWQDCMLANLDPPEDEAFTALLEAELTTALRAAASHPCLAVVCGGSEIEQQAAMSGLSPAAWRSTVLDELVPRLAAELAPGVPYVTSTPTGGSLPFRPGAGVAHYFGVGAYLRPLEDARRAGVRFAAECLAFSTPPEPETVDEQFGGPSAAGHRPDWKAGVARDPGTSWDFEDIRDRYVERLFGLDARTLRYTDPARSLELGRAAVVECFEAVLSEWRRPGSSCAGAVVLAGRDLWPGAGWGVVDSAGRPKAPWFALRRAFAPVALLATDEGLNGWRLHVCNDAATPLSGTLEVALYRDGEILVEKAELPVEVPERAGISLDAATVLDGFRDVTYAYRFGPPGHDVAVAELRDSGGEALSEAVLLPLGGGRRVEADLGLRAAASWTGTGWVLECSSRRLAERVAISLDGFQPLDSWFHLVPGRTRRVLVRPLVGVTADPAAPPRGELRALNLAWPARVGV